MKRGQVATRFENNMQDQDKGSIWSCLLLLEKRGFSLDHFPVDLYKKLIFLKANLVAPFFILTASEMQIDFASDQLFSLFVLG